MKAALALVLALQGAALAHPRGAVPVGPGTYHPAVGSPDGAPVPVARFWLDREPVTNAQFLAFVRAHPAWRKGRAAAPLVEGRYLAKWAGPDRLGPARPRAPVVDVSWFAARAYCAARGGRLPREAEWELAAAADAHRKDATADPAFEQQILAWYAEPLPAQLPDVGGAPNAWGVRDLHGLIWEWIDDFTGVIVAADDSGGCAAEAVAAKDPGAYAAFVRAALRSSLAPRDTTDSLGFRCAYDDAPAPAPAPAATALPSPRADAGSLYALALPLRDTSGRTIALDVDRGHPTLVAMFYASCTVTCPALIDELGRAIATLPPDERDQVRVLLVSFDPARDTPTALAELARAHRLDDRWTLAAPRSDADARALAGVLGIKYRPLGNGAFFHTTAVVLLDADGRPVARATDLADPTALARQLAAIAGR